jgi:N-glycosylase/DNA lyase
VTSTSSGHITGIRRENIDLSTTLRSGQVFRWNEDADHTWHGVLENRFAVRLQQSDEDASIWWEADIPNAESAVRSFLRLGTEEPDLAALGEVWSTADTLFAEAWARNPGIRVLRQDPDECFFAFLCASVAPIARISGMLRAVAGELGLALTPGTLWVPSPNSGRRESGNNTAFASHKGLQSANVGAKPQTLTYSDSPLPELGEGQGVRAAYTIFPTATQIATTTEERLRELGLGFRAKRVIEAARVLTQLPADHLSALRHNATHDEAKKELTAFFGVGEKIADCVCLFGLDKDGAIPVDTHIWRIAVTRYAPDLAGKSLTAANYARVTQAFHDRFGPLAGWAQQTLFFRAAVGRQRP